MSLSLAAVCARNKDRAEAFADQWGYESVETDWRKLIERDDIDVIDIAAPNNVHHDIAIAAAEAGKAILCEKPLALNCKEGEAMVRSVEKAGVPNMVWYNYRRVPAVTLSQRILSTKAALGKFITTGPTFFRTGPSTPTFPRAAKASGG